MERPSLTIVINTSGRLDCLQHSLRSILEDTQDQTGVEVVLVDNSSDGRVAPLFQEWLPRLPILRYEREPRMGMIPARNAGVRAARNDIIAYVDDDAVLHRGWVDGLLGTYQRFWDGRSPIAVGGPATLRYPEGVNRPAWLTPLLENWLTRLDLGSADRVLDHPDECLVGANFSAPTAIVRGFGGFPDLGLKYGADERSIEHLVTEAGGQIVYSAKAHVDHLVQASRLEPQWFRNRFQAEGLSRQRLNQALTRRPFPILALRALAFAARMVLSQIRSRLLPAGSGQRLEVECRSRYDRGCLSSTWHLMTVRKQPSLRPEGGLSCVVPTAESRG